MSNYEWAPYVSVAQRRRQAEKVMEQQRRKGLPVSPVVITGRAIAATFWGKAWCENLEHYSDYANRLPRGRTYVRNGSVVDLAIAPGLVKAQVSGSSLYRVEVKVKPVPGTQWQALCADCGGAIASLVELLQGRFSKAVMERLCLQGTGLFPAPREIVFSCSCPDGAYMCKHVAAVLYGIGARLDAEPELLFRLRGVDGGELLARAASGLAVAAPAPGAGRVLEEDDLSALFGLDLATGGEAPTAAPPKAAKPAAVKPVAVKPVAAKPVAAKPVAAKPVAARPVAVKPVAARPVAAKPVAARPVAAKPVAAKPVAAKPVAVKPLAAKSAAAKPVAVVPPRERAQVQSPRRGKAKPKLKPRVRSGVLN